jgi:hypothetical protein
MRLSSLVVAALVLLLGPQSVAFAQVPKSTVDFDRSVGFSVPRNITVYPAVEGNDVVFLVPNGLQIALKPNGAPRVGLTHTGIGRGGDLILRLGPTIDGVPIQEIVSDLKVQYPALRFAVPGPKSSRFEIAGAGLPPQSLPGHLTGDPMAGDFVYAVRLSPLSVRVLLTPRSYQMAVFAISIQYDLRGMSRDSAGNLALETRNFRMSMAMEGFCALSPESVLNASSGVNGCVHPKYSRNLVKQIQLRLREHGTDPGPVDGSYGLKTELAIRKLESQNRLPVDGIPSPELLEFLLPLTVKSAKK